MKESCESNLEISAGRVRHMFRAEKRRKILADNAMVQPGGFTMKQSIVIALFLLLQGAGIGHVSANPYPSTYKASAHSPYVLVSQAIDAGEGEGWFSGWVQVENNRISAVNTMDVPLPEGIEIRDVGQQFVTPGIIDVHLSLIHI